jgi:SOS-response transcriptional repressor LexA
VGEREENMHQQQPVHFGRWLKDEIENRGSITEFVHTSGIPRATLNVWFRQAQPRITGRWFGKLAESLGTSSAELRATLRSVPATVPTFDLSVAAGGWQEVLEVGELHDPGQIDRGLFRIRIRGDSMQPRWPNGSLVEFRCVRGELVVGRDYYVQREDEATFKRLVKATEEQLLLGAINRRKYPEPMIVDRHSLRRVAEAVFLLVVPED